MLEPGTKNGEILSGPASWQAMAVCRIRLVPPIPGPIATPIRRCLGGADLDARILQRVGTGRDTVLDEDIHFLELLALDIALGLETLDLACNARRKRAGAEAGDRADPADPVHDAPPRRLQIIADR